MRRSSAESDSSTQLSWTELRPALASKASRDAFVALAQSLGRTIRQPDDAGGLEDLRTGLIEEATCSRQADRQALLAAGLVLTDLAAQRWQMRTRSDVVKVKPPTELEEDRAGEKARIRKQELVKRDAQLRQPAVRKFILSMERPRVFNGRFVSIYSLMRDGRELAEALQKARPETGADPNALADVVDPYLEFIPSDNSTCRFTGLRLMDIWRYFRHTWTNQYTSVPGRSMAFLVRDRAAPFHAVAGLGALSSPVMQIRERDTWIGWHPDTFMERIRTEPSDELAQWLVRVVDTAISEIYVDDLLEDGVISRQDLNNPTSALLDRLLEESVEQRRLHHRYVRSRDYKTRRANLSDSEHWVTRARTHLFRSKRALALGSYLRARSVLKDAFCGHPTGKKLADLTASGRGTDAIRRILKKAKADRVGIAVADLTVCGAIQPYNALLGGKLVAMLACSPEVTLEYRRRYSQAVSEIASGVAGRAIIRKPMLALLGTTSLYGVGSSQYNRITIPCDRIGGAADEMMRYEDLGHSKSFGTSQYAEETVEALVDLVQQTANGRRVNSIFGEGISPKLRKVREGLSLLGLPPDLLLRHHRRRVVYAVSFVRNLGDYLLGLDAEPRYLLPSEDGPAATARIAAWWRERWLRKRIASDDVLGDLARHNLVRPIRHGARVESPPEIERQLTFDD